jgi:putative FmdB family regulatory protein
VATYAYECRACGEQFEISRPMSAKDELDKNPPACPKCSKTDVQRVPGIFTPIRDWRTT